MNLSLKDEYSFLVQLVNTDGYQKWLEPEIKEQFNTMKLALLRPGQSTETLHQAIGGLRVYEWFLGIPQKIKDLEAAIEEQQKEAQSAEYDTIGATQTG